MIGRIRGIILAKQPPQLLLEVAGVGYEIAAPMTTFYHLPELHEEAILYTHLIVREDAHILYGFHKESDRRLFRALIKVNGIGPKLALTILSGIESHQFVQCVTMQNTTYLTSIPGVGKKTAERLIMETKDALTAWQADLAPHNAQNDCGPNQSQQDAISALIALGYKPKDAKRAINNIKQSTLTSEALIRIALKQMVTGV